MAPKGSRSSIASGRASTALASCGVSKRGMAGPVMCRSSDQPGKQRDAEHMRRPASLVRCQWQQDSFEIDRLATILKTITRVFVTRDAEAGAALERRAQPAEGVVGLGPGIRQLAFQLAAGTRRQCRADLQEAQPRRAVPGRLDGQQV